MSDSPSPINRQIGERVRQLRADAGLSLEALAGRSGVSRSMISSVERGDSSPRSSFSSVVLPPPLGPTTATIASGGTWKVTLCCSSCPP